MIRNSCETSKMHLYSFILPKNVVLLLNFLIIFCSIINETDSANRVVTVEVNKCCPLDGYLDNTQNCVATGGTENWYPKIYLIQRKSLFNKTGRAPPFIKAVENNKPECINPSFFAEKESDSVVLFSNGSLYLSHKHIILEPKQFCIDKDAVLACMNEKLDSLRAPLTTVKKCCGPNSIFVNENRTCVALNPNDAGYYPSITTSSHVDLIFGFPSCPEGETGYAIAGKFMAGNLDDESGAIKIESGKEFTASEYCLEHVLEEKAASVFTCPEHFAAIPIPNQDIRYTLYAAGLLVSVIFLVVTLAASFLVPSNHHLLHWKCQTHYVACLLVGDLMLAIVQLSGNSIAQPGCSIIAIFMHFFFLAAFFWLNTMCFNIWWTFRDFRPTSLEKGQEQFRLRMYELYAWGFPLIIASVAAILDYLPETPEDNFLRPKFGKNHCWFYGDMEILTYFYGPIGILLFVNVLLFASTARQLTCGLWKRDDVKTTTERAALGRVCMKLVVVMGVTWVADVISWAVGGPNYMWYLTDLINALQGVFIFVVVVCQPQVWTAIKRLFNSKKGRSFTNTTNGPQHSSSSHALPSVGDTVTQNTAANATSVTNPTTTSTKIPMETVC